jgi:hypothetical protein
VLVGGGELVRLGAAIKRLVTPAVS